MKHPGRNCLLFILLIFLVSCKNPQKETSQPSHEDVHFRQDYSIKYRLEDSVRVSRVYSDRNGVVQVSTSKNLYKPHGGEFLYTGSLVPDRYYRPVADKNIANLVLYKDHLVYIDDKAVLSNAWAGNLYVKHSLPRANLLAGGEDFDFLISDGKAIQYLKDSAVVWEGQHSEPILDIIFESTANRFLILGQHSILSFSPLQKSLKTEFTGDGMTCF